MSRRTSATRAAPDSRTFILDSPDSDLDLLADLPPGLSLFGLGRLADDLETIVHARVDLIPAADLKPGVRQRVERDAVAL